MQAQSKGHVTVLPQSEINRIWTAVFAMQVSYVPFREYFGAIHNSPTLVSPTPLFSGIAPCLFFFFSQGTFRLLMSLVSPTVQHAHYCINRLQYGNMDRWRQRSISWVIVEPTQHVCWKDQRKNNAVEWWHQDLKRFDGSPHPNIFKIESSLKKEGSLVGNELECRDSHYTHAGLQGRPFAGKNERLERFKMDFPSR